MKLIPKQIEKKIIAGTNFFLFPLSLFLLLTLAVWWFILHRSHINEIYNQKLTILELQAQTLANKFSHQKSFPTLLPQEQEYFLLLPAEELKDNAFLFAYPLAPQWQHYYIVLKPQQKQEIEKKRVRRIFMISGEGFFLILLLLVPIFMLYRLLISEKQARQEAESFFRMVSHELKTPVAALQALLDTLLQRTLKSEQVKKYALLGLQENRRLRGMIENMLYLQKMNMDIFDGKPAILPLDDQLQNYIQRRNQLFPSQKMIFQNKCESPCLSFFDSNLLQHVLENLIDNAFKYSPVSEPVNILLQKEQNYAAIYVQDNGDGIDEKDIGNIFKKFYRLQENKNRASGIGMGLYIVQKLVGRMKGNVEVISRGKGKGTTFIIRLQLGDKEQ